MGKGKFTTPEVLAAFIAAKRNIASARHGARS